jgi:hypothetical protein
MVSKFNLRNVAKVGDLHSFLSEATLRRVTPSLFALEPHHSRSDRYAYIPTWEIIEGLAEEGFKPVFAAQAHTRDLSKRGYTKHLVRFRRESDIVTGKSEVPEIVTLNSHGGESRFQMFNGVFRGICLNSNVYGDVHDDIRLRHSGKLVEDVTEAAFRLVKSFDKVMGQVEEWKGVRLSGDEQHAFAESAAVLRLGPPVEGQPQRLIDASEFNTVRRDEDRAPDLWTTFSRVQENVIAGGAEGELVSPNGRRRRTTTRPVNGIDMSVSLNRALWTLGERMAELKG